MNVVHLQTNHLSQPLGIHLDPLSLSYQVEQAVSQHQQAARIEIALDAVFSQPVFDSGRSTAISSLGFQPDLTLQPRTRYYWRVTVWGDNGSEQATSEVAWFETAKLDEPWLGQWIAAAPAAQRAPWLIGRLPETGRGVRRARAYVCGLGVYELYINARKVSDELLAPGCHAYDQWVQYQTYDLAGYLQGGENEVRLLLGDGWYKGRFGFNKPDARHHYGDTCMALLELHIEYEDGSTQVLASGADWQWQESAIVSNSLYDGESQDWRRQDEPAGQGPCRVMVAGEAVTPRLQARRNPPVQVQSRHAPLACQPLDDGSYLLDFGQNMVGWVEFVLDEAAGQTVTLEYAEALQDGQLYRDNLRTAQARFQVTADGSRRTVRPHFTFFGFRYVRVQGISRPPVVADFSACFIHSRMAPAGEVVTGHPLVNRFVDNVLRSQKGNFLDVPTDCPQRDERMGWTGDIQIFAGTACYNLDVYAFLAKFLHDLAAEQRKLDGSVPFVVPMFDMQQAGSSGWGDAATVIPWQLWLHYGDVAILRQQYASMKGWVDFISRQVAAQADEPALWASGFHFGDWLAMDNEPHIRSFKGRTEDRFIASIYYMFSAGLTAKAAAVLGDTQDAHHYAALAERLRTAIRAEYLTATGRLALETQTAYVLAIMFDIYAPHQLARGGQDLVQRLKRDQFSIKSGFIGTPYFCLALTKAGCADVAYDLFLDTRCPSWLYAVTQGATSIWERWDGIHENGALNEKSAMNSLNHYALGSVMEWVYRDVCGLQPDEARPGFKAVTIAPVMDTRLQHAALTHHAAAGTYQVRWALDAQGHIEVTVKVPFDCQATLKLPDAQADAVTVSGLPVTWQQQGSYAVAVLGMGEYHFSYSPTRDYIKRYGLEMSLKTLRAHPGVELALQAHIPAVMALPFLGMLENESVRELSQKPFFNYDADVLDTLEQVLKQFVVSC